MEQVSAYNQYFTNKQLKELPVGKELVSVEENYGRIQRQAASIPQAMKQLQKERERVELF